MNTREFHPGMGRAVAERTILRPGEEWGDVADRVADGNCSLVPSGAEDLGSFKSHLHNATILMSGRHLQHGDLTQKTRPYEVFTNCSSSAASFILFYLLLNGSGVGRVYDDDMMLTNWDNCPSVRCVLDETHPDFDYSAHESVRDAKHKYGQGNSVHWFEVPDSREGWAQAIEHMETMAFQKAFRDDLLVINFTPVRGKGSPIAGMQDRPSSGPVPMMNALHKIATLKGAGLAPWLQALYVDHYLAEPVLVGGARRAARMAMKIWTDKSTLEFIKIKRPLDGEGFPFLWSSNNSVAVDADFWRRLKLTPDQQGYNSDLTRHAREVFKAVTECSYYDGTGEPGLVNVDQLVDKDDGKPTTFLGDYVGSPRYQVADATRIYLAGLQRKALSKKYLMVPNPCVSGDTPILTEEGYVDIIDRIGLPTNIWNGNEWSEVTPFATGFNPTVRVLFSDGTFLRCTPEHEFIIQEGWTKSGVQMRRKAAKLLPGNKLAKFTMPKVLPGVHYGSDREAYTQGFYSGDGTRGYTHSWLYEPKFVCEDRLLGKFQHIGNQTHRKTWRHGPLKDKSWVPVDATLNYAMNWLAGLCDSDGTISRDSTQGTSIQIASVDANFLLQVRLMLSRLGVQAKVTASHPAAVRAMPDGRGGTKDYNCQELWRLLISPCDTYELYASGLFTSRLDNKGHKPQRAASQFVKVVEVIEDEPCETFCFTEPKNHTGTFNGIVTGQCGEQPLALYGAYCTLADVVPYHAASLEEAEDAFKHAARALLRVNTMPSLYAAEVARTNRIGVGMTGVHEYAWKFFKVGFRDLVAPDFGGYAAAESAWNHDKTYLEVIEFLRDGGYPPGVRAAAFWESFGQFSRSMVRDACHYATEVLSQNAPHTIPTMKPAGTTSKLFGLTEGDHLPALAHYLRWVQFRDNDPLIADYEAQGYPVRRDLKTYEGTAIVGFPTEPTIATLNMGNQLVLAGEASPEDQYKWLQLGEFFWLEGGSVNDYLKGEGARPGEDRYGSQISYTLKYKPNETSFEEFTSMMLEYQPTIRCCSVMPEINADDSVYEYLPEQPLTKAEFEATLSGIRSAMSEDIGREHVGCDNGACPVDFK
jgi:hypothetical protein